MGYDRARFEHTPSTALICPVCSGVFENAVQCPDEHGFCGTETCLRNWISEHGVCPNDQRTLTRGDLRPMSRLIINIINQMELKCRFAEQGCTEVIRVDHETAHADNCPFNNEVTMTTIAAQRQIEEMTAMEIASKEAIKKLAEEVKKFAEANSSFEETIETVLVQIKNGMKTFKKRVNDDFNSLLMMIGIESEQVLKCQETVKNTRDHIRKVEDHVLSRMEPALRDELAQLHVRVDHIRQTYETRTGYRSRPQETAKEHQSAATVTVAVKETKDKWTEIHHHLLFDPVIYTEAVVQGDYVNDDQEASTSADATNKKKKKRKKKKSTQAEGDNSAQSNGMLDSEQTNGQKEDDEEENEPEAAYIDETQPKKVVVAKPIATISPLVSAARCESSREVTARGRLETPLEPDDNAMFTPHFRLSQVPENFWGRRPEMVSTEQFALLRLLEQEGVLENRGRVREIFNHLDLGRFFPDVTFSNNEELRGLVVQVGFIYQNTVAREGRKTLFVGGNLFLAVCAAILLGPQGTVYCAAFSSRQLGLAGYSHLLTEGRLVFTEEYRDNIARGHAQHDPYELILCNEEHYTDAVGAQLDLTGIAVDYDDGHDIETGICY